MSVDQLTSYVSGLKSVFLLNCSSHFVFFCVTTIYRRFYQLFLFKSLTYFGARQLLNK